VQQVGVKVYIHNVVAPKTNNIKFANAQQAQVTCMGFSHLNVLLNCNKYEVKYMNESIKHDEYVNKFYECKQTQIYLCKKKNEKMA
jgi:hypothetical protein